MFEFYFQSGDFAGDVGGFWDFIKDATVQLLGTFGGAAGALWLYNRQRKDQTEKDNEAKADSNLDRLLFFDHLISESIRSTKFIETELNELLDKLHRDPTNLSNFGAAPLENLRRLVFEFSRFELLSAYRYDFGQNLRNTFNCIDSWYSVIESAKGIWMESRDKMQKRKLIIGDSVNKIFDELRAIIVVSAHDIILSNKIDLIISDYFEKPYEAEDYYKDLEESLLDPIIDNLNRDDLENKTKWIAVLNSCVNVKKEIRVLNNDGISLYINLQHPYDTLIEIHNTFEVNYKPISIYISKLNPTHP
jgi:hypothetical protein